MIAVNGRNVSKSPHNDVVRLIGQSSGVLQLQIAENYCSDSSSEEEGAAGIRLKPKYPHRRTPGKGQGAAGGNSGKPGQGQHVKMGRGQVLAEVHDNTLTTSVEVHQAVGGIEPHSDNEDYTNDRRDVRPMHVRGNSADSTFTEATIQPAQKPRRASPKVSLGQNSEK